jgi:hypothetical protein
MNNAPHQVELECGAEQLDLVKNTIINKITQYHIVAAIECPPPLQTRLPHLPAPTSRPLSLSRCGSLARCSPVASSFFLACEACSRWLEHRKSNMELVNPIPVERSSWVA